MEDSFPLEGRYEFWNLSRVIIMLVNKNGLARYLNSSAAQFQFTFSPRLLRVGSRLHGYCACWHVLMFLLQPSTFFLSFVRFWISHSVYFLFSVTYRCLYILLGAYITQQPSSPLVSSLGCEQVKQKDCILFIFVCLNRLSVSCV